jgi:hypothetical protein
VDYYETVNEVMRTLRPEDSDDDRISFLDSEHERDSDDESMGGSISEHGSPLAAVARGTGSAPDKLHASSTGSSLPTGSAGSVPADLADVGRRSDSESGSDSEYTDGSSDAEFDRSTDTDEDAELLAKVRPPVLTAQPYQ